MARRLLQRASGRAFMTLIYDSLIYDYALEPELLAKCPPSLWRYFAIEKEFSWDAGFVVVLYPRKWDKLIRSLVTDRRRLNFLLELIKTWPRVVCPASMWNPDYTWLENAESETCYPFHAILSLCNPKKKPNVASVKDIDGKASLWRFNPPPSITVDRTAASMAACIKPMLRYAQRIRFIDPHFCPSDPRFRDPLRKFLSIICYGSRKVELEYHASADNRPDNWCTFEDNCKRHLPCLIPSGFNITIRRWWNKRGNERFHNRYILTNIGGVSFGNSISEQPNGKDTVCRLSSTDCHSWIDKYSDDTSTFHLEGEVTISG